DLQSRVDDDNLTPDYPIFTSIAIAVDKCGEASTANFTVLKALWSQFLPDYFRRASFSSFLMPVNPAYNLVLDKSVNIGCPATTDIKNWAITADRNVPQMGAQRVDLGRYRSHVYILPPSFGELWSFGTIMCPLAGTNDIPRVWTAARDQTELLRTLLHELGHNLGLFHSQGYDANGVIQEYGDPGCPMGPRTLAHYNAPHSVWLGWTKPQEVLQAADLTVGSWSSFRVMGLANAATSSLQFHPGTWMPYGSAWDKNDLLYVSFRHYTTATVDSGLPDGCRNKVQIHRQPLDPGGCGAPILITQLDERGSWPKRNSQNASDLISPLLVVTVTSIDTKTGTANVKVCRASQFTAETGAQCRDGLDNNCDGLIDNC
ncbi:hypothetical protein Vretimale_16272, partial [Volvox reticuliferus]